MAKENFAHPTGSVDASRFVSLGADGGQRRQVFEAYLIAGPRPHKWVIILVNVVTRPNIGA